MNLNKKEIETIINLNCEDAVAYIHTRIPKHYRHFIKLGIKPTKIHKDSEGKEYGWDFKVPAKYVRMPKPPTTRNISDKQRAELRKRLAKARKT